MTFLYDIERRVACVHVPKAGGTSLIHTLLNWSGVSFRPFLPEQGHLHGGLIHASVREARVLLQMQWPDGATVPQPWLLIGTVRHPLRRFVSAFNQTRRMGLHSCEPTEAGIRHLLTDVLGPMADALRGDVWPPANDLVRFFARQTALVQAADTVLHLETLDTDMRHWVSTCGRFSEKVQATLQPVAMLHEGPTEDSLRVQDVLTWSGDTLTWLADMYEAEAVAFGYSWPL